MKNSREVEKFTGGTYVSKRWRPVPNWCSDHPSTASVPRENCKSAFSSVCASSPVCVTLYSVTQTGLEAHTLENALLQFSRGTEAVEGWSLHQLGTGRHLFDTYVPPVNFSTSREFFISRYGALDVPPDDATDSRLN